MLKVVVVMKTAEGKDVIRTIDSSVFMVHDGETSYITSSVERQGMLLKEWISERANAQHDTNLTLCEWTTF